MKKIALALLIILIGLFLFGCTETDAPTTTDTNLAPVVTPKDTNTTETNTPSQEFLDSICYDNDKEYYNYYEENNVNNIVELSKQEDYNAHGLCTSFHCISYQKQVIKIEEDLITYDINEFFDINTYPRMYQLTYYVPGKAKDLEMLVNNETVNFSKTYNYDYSSTFPIQMEDEYMYDLYSFIRMPHLGKNVVNYSYSTKPQKACMDNVCIYPLTIFGYPTQGIELEIESYGKILNTQEYKFVGGRTILLAVSNEPTFKVGKLKFSESQRRFYEANKKRIDWISERIDYAENLVSQRTPNEVFVFFTNSVRAETSFTSIHNGLIIMQGDNFDNYFEEALLHELNHQAITNYYLPDWLREGTAHYLGSKYSARDIPNFDNNKHITTRNKISYYLREYSFEEYNYAASVVEKFISKYGCNKFKDFLFELNALGPNYLNERNVIENAMKQTIGDYSYKNLIDKNI
jgi:hypothetical protein